MKKPVKDTNQSFAYTEISQARKHLETYEKQNREPRKAHLLIGVPVLSACIAFILSARFGGITLIVFALVLVAWGIHSLVKDKRLW